MKEKNKKTLSIQALRNLHNVEKDCFVFRVKITVKKDKSKKIVLGSKNSNESCIKIRPPLPDLEKSRNQISTELTREQSEPICISKVDLRLFPMKVSLDSHQLVDGHSERKLRLNRSSDEQILSNLSTRDELLWQVFPLL